jgi:ribonuclease H / adenosylcobalamin/alpha-ribazole phosphatase
VKKVLVEADGGSRGNPGPAGYGAVVLDPATHDVLVERSAGLGVATNNVAEYRGLIAGLQAARELGATDVDVRMDSKLVVEQMSGRWKIKHPDLRPLAMQAAGLVRELGSVRFAWIPRERNTRADALANQAMDIQAGRSDGSTVRDDPVLDNPVLDNPALDDAVLADRASPLLDEPQLDLPDLVTVAPPPTVASEPPPSAAWTGQAGTPTRLVLLRHGQTAASVQNRYSGRGDPELTALGQDQAARAAARLAAPTAGGLAPDGIAAVLSSPLRRARQTAAAVADALGVPLEVRDGLIETNFGGWEGLTFGEAAERDPDLHARWLGNEQVAPPGGESFAAVGARLAQERAAILAAYPGSTVVVVTHVTPIKLLLRDALASGPEILYRLHLDLASLSVADFYPDGGASVRLVNDIGHHAQP